MGSSNNSQTQISPEYSQLQYYTTAEDSTYGLCEIYSSNKFPSCFIIKIIAPLSQTTKLQLFSKLENQQNIYLLSLYGYRIGKNCHCKMQNIVTETVISFWEYLSHSLRDVIEHRKKIGLKFREIEIWHIIKACSHGYQAFQKMHTCYDFMPSKLMVNQQGRIRLSWMHVQQKNEHSHCLNKILGKTGLLGNEDYLAPQQLEAIEHKQLTSKINFEKCNMFSLGMTLLECLTLISPIPNFYGNLKVNYLRIEQVMHLSICNIYSQNLLMLVGSMLRMEPLQRPTFAKIISRYSGFMKREFSILIKSPSFSNQNSVVPNSKPQSVSIRNSLKNNF